MSDFLMLIFHLYDEKKMIDTQIMAQIMDFQKFDFWPIF